MPSSKVIASERQFCYTSEDFHWPSGNQKSQIELSNVSTFACNILASHIYLDKRTL